MRIEIWQRPRRPSGRAPRSRARARERRAALASARRCDHRARARAMATPRCCDLTATLDRVELASLEVGQTEFAAAGERLSDAQRAAIRAAVANIEALPQAAVPAPLAVETAPGVRCERVSRPIERVGLYVPAGQRAAALHGAHARRAGAARRLPDAGAVHAAAARRPRRSRRALAARSCGIDARVQARRRAGDRGARLRHRDACRRSTRSSAPATSGSPRPRQLVDRRSGRRRARLCRPGRPRCW